MLSFGFQEPLSVCLFLPTFQIFLCWFYINCPGFSAVLSRRNRENWIYSRCLYPVLSGNSWCYTKIQAGDGRMGTKGFGGQGLRLESSTGTFQRVWPWLGHLISLSLHFLIRNEIIVIITNLQVFMWLQWADKCITFPTIKFHTNGSYFKCELGWKWSEEGGVSRDYKAVQIFSSWFSQLFYELAKICIWITPLPPRYLCQFPGTRGCYLIWQKMWFN